MKILYFGELTDKDIYKKKIQEEQPYFVAQYMYELAIKNEFDNDKDLSIKYISIYQSEYFPKKPLIINLNKKNRSTEFYYLPYINIPFFREISFLIMTMIQIIKWKISTQDKEKLIYSSNHFAPVSLGIFISSKLFNITNVVTFTDLALFSYSKKRIEKMKWYKKLIIKPYVALVDFLQKQYDGYVLFTNKMNQIVNPKRKPYVVVEGIYNPTNFGGVVEKESNVIFHAGTLNKEVGIGKIIEIIKSMKDYPIEFWFAGRGDMDKEIHKLIDNNYKVKHLGFIEKNSLFNYLKKSSLLINLRNPKDEYTKYSFPSKMFEYMASGTPVFTTKLEGIPDEYYQYLFYTDSYENKKIEKEILNFFNMDIDDRRAFGEKAKSFIINNKNSSKQVAKIRVFIKDLNKKSK